MNEYATAWVASRDRVIAALSQVSPDALNSYAPLCPEWRVRDIAGHLVGISQDIAAGNFPGDLDEWAAGQVARNFDAPLDALLGEWPTLGLENVVSKDLAIVLYDQVTHECDILHALGRPATVDRACLTLLGEFTLGRFATGDNDLSVTLHLEGDTLQRGTGQRELNLHAEYFEWFRASTGRRSRSQIDAMDWRGDRSAIDVLFTSLFQPAELDVVESWQSAES